jgi:acyl-CoA synthetase (AMP-forming)/AMP-acid ligase II
MPLPAFVPERTVPAMLERCVRRGPDRVALVATSYQLGERQITYAELDDEARRLAGFLHSHGLSKGDRVGILVENGGAADAHLAYHAAHRVGAINVPLNGRYVERELAYALDFAQPAAIVFGPVFANMLASIYSDRPQPLLIEASDTPMIGHDLRACLRSSATVDVDEVEEHDDADWIFTSGTTGNPKAVAITHGSSVACGYQSQQLWGLQANSVYSSSAPFFTSTGCHTNLLGTLAAGCTYVCELDFSPDEVLDRLQRYGVTSTFIISGMLGLMIKRLGAATLAEHDLGSLKRLCYGGQPMSADFYRQVEAIFGSGRSQPLELVHLYGLTEGGTSGLMVPPEAHQEAVEAAGVHGMAVGTRGFNDWIDYQLVDDDGADVAEGEIGEICLRAPSLMDRYVDEPEATSESLRDGWLHTGDMGHVAGGRVYFVDRRKQMIRRGGLNISSAEIEAVVSGLPGVAEVAAVPVPNPVLGEEVGLVVVVEDSCPDVPPSEPSIVDHCKRNLADYKVPTFVRFAPELPRNAMGRVTKQQLLSLFKESLDDRSP